MPAPHDLKVNLQKKLQILQNKTMMFVLGYPPPLGLTLA